MWRGNRGGRGGRGGASKPLAMPVVRRGGLLGSQNPSSSTADKSFRLKKEIRSISRNSIADLYDSTCRSILHRQFDNQPLHDSRSDQDIGDIKYFESESSPMSRILNVDTPTPLSKIDMSSPGKYAEMVFKWSIVELHAQLESGIPIVIEAVRSTPKTAINSLMLRIVGETALRTKQKGSIVRLTLGTKGAFAILSRSLQSDYLLILDPSVEEPCGRYHEFLQEMQQKVQQPNANSKKSQLEMWQLTCQDTGVTASQSEKYFTSLDIIKKRGSPEFDGIIKSIMQHGGQDYVPAELDLPDLFTKDQSQFFRAVHSGAALVMLQGAAGSGKTLSASSVCAVIPQSDCILFVAETNQALAEIADTLSTSCLVRDATGQLVMGKYGATQISWLISEHGLQQIPEHLKRFTVKKLANAAPECRVILMTADMATNLSSNDLSFARVMLVDEASMMQGHKVTTLADNCKNLRQLIFTGDPAQLRPVVMSDALKATDYARSAFDWFGGKGPLIMLTEVRRTPEAVTKMVNPFYNGKLIYKGFGQSLEWEKFFDSFTPRRSNAGVLAVEYTGAGEEERGTSWSSQTEGIVLINLLKRLFAPERKIPRGPVAILTLYRPQKELIIEYIDKHLPELKSRLTVRTVSETQGSEVSLSIFLLTRTGRGFIGFADDSHFLNVGCTRANQFQVLVYHTSLLDREKGPLATMLDVLEGLPAHFEKVGTDTYRWIVDPHEDDRLKIAKKGESETGMPEFDAASFRRVWNEWLNGSGSIDELIAGFIMIPSPHVCDSVCEMAATSLTTESIRRSREWLQALSCYEWALNSPDKPAAVGMCRSVLKMWVEGWVTSFQATESSEFHKQKAKVKEDLVALNGIFLDDDACADISTLLI